jgi:eukaryotic-like serine/threonine-protein kinase
MPLASQIDLPERYRVARHIASGGMASVWEVEDQLLGRVVAVKVLSAQFAADPGARARFQREARTAAQVSAHPHVVTIYDIGEHGDDAFIVMEYFPGGSVADRLRAARDGASAIDRDTALRWLREAAAGLDVAHSAGIVHRDVKPANLLLDAQDRVAVADFGIARLADDTHMTQTGQVLGTAAYLSPEQATGQPATAASDRYALAVVAFELLCGRRPFDGGPPAAQLLQHAEEAPPRASEAAPGLPRAVDDVFAAGLAKDPAARPATAGELVDALESALEERPTDSTRPMPAAAVPPPAAAAPAAAAAAV